MTTLYLKQPSGQYRLAEAAEILQVANLAIDQRFATGQSMTSVEQAKPYLKTKLASYRHEVFFVLFLDTRHRIIKAEVMFQGTIDGASVYPREVVKRALELNAAAVIVAHNHPSGDTSPSRADEKITRRLIDALALVDIRVLDHCIVGQAVYSFAEDGKL